MDCLCHSVVVLPVCRCTVLILHILYTVYIIVVFRSAGIILNFVEEKFNPNLDCLKCIGKGEPVFYKGDNCWVSLQNDPYSSVLYHGSGSQSFKDLHVQSLASVVGFKLFNSYGDLKQLWQTSKLPISWSCTFRIL